MIVTVRPNRFSMSSEFFVTNHSVMNNLSYDGLIEQCPQFEPVEIDISQLNVAVDKQPIKLLDLANASDPINTSDDSLRQLILRTIDHQRNSKWF